MVGTILALDIIAATPHITRANILLDNQAAIRALASREVYKPGRYLLDIFHDTLDDLLQRRPNLQIHLAWVPGHEDVVENEEADVRAKEAAERKVANSALTIAHFPSPLPRSVAALKAAYQKATTPQWMDLWRASPRAARLSKFADIQVGRRVLKLYRDLSRRDASLLTQLRTGHIGLHRYLHCIGVADSPRCPACNEVETPRHYLLLCNRYQERRRKLRREVKGILSMRTLLDKPGNREALFQYVHGTARFSHYLPDPE